MWISMWIVFARKQRAVLTEIVVTIVLAREEITIAAVTSDPPEVVTILRVPLVIETERGIEILICAVAKWVVTWTLSVMIAAVVVVTRMAVIVTVITRPKTTLAALAKVRHFVKVIM